MNMKTNETEEIKMLKPLNGYACLNEKNNEICQR
jgi:hypothetical protein